MVAYKPSGILSTTEAAAERPSGVDADPDHALSCLRRRRLQARQRTWILEESAARRPAGGGDGRQRGAIGVGAGNKVRGTREWKRGTSVAAGRLPGPDTAVLCERRASGCTQRREFTMQRSSADDVVGRDEQRMGRVGRVGGGQTRPKTQHARHSQPRRRPFCPEAAPALRRRLAVSAPGLPRVPLRSDAGPSLLRHLLAPSPALVAGEEWSVQSEHQQLLCAPVEHPTGPTAFALPRMDWATQYGLRLSGHLATSAAATAPHRARVLSNTFPKSYSWSSRVWELETGWIDIDTLSP